MITVSDIGIHSVFEEVVEVFDDLILKRDQSLFVLPPVVGGIGPGRESEDFGCDSRTLELAFIHAGGAAARENFREDDERFDFVFHGPLFHGKDFVLGARDVVADDVNLFSRDRELVENLESHLIGRAGQSHFLGRHDFGEKGNQTFHFTFMKKIGRGKGARLEASAGNDRDVVISLQR